MAKARKPGRTWGYSPGKDPATKPGDALKAEVERKAKAFIETDLVPKHVQTPPADPRFNYVSGFSTKWHGRYFYFVSTYTCPREDAISPTFDANFARLEHTGMGKFNLGFQRHNNQWITLFEGQTLDECLASIRDDPWFQM